MTIVEQLAVRERLKCKSLVVVEQLAVRERLKCKSLIVVEQLAVRERLKCKSFKWFMEEVAADLLKYFPYEEPANLAEGEVGKQRRRIDILLKLR